MALKLSSSVGNLPERHKDCGFGNYKTTSDNEKQFEACKNWDGKSSITLTGKTGTGKTHLAISMLRNMPMIEVSELDAAHNKNHYERGLEGKYLTRNRQGQLVDDKEYYKKMLDNELWKYREARCAFFSFVEIFIEINNAAMADAGKLETLKRYSTNKIFDCICFDDLGAEKLTDAKRENLYYIIDSRYREMLPTIITSNFTIAEISEVEPRIASRLAEMGQILQFNGSDYRKSIK